MNVLMRFLEEMFAQVSIDPIQNIVDKLNDPRIGNFSRICLRRSLPDIIESSDLHIEDKRLFLELLNRYI